MMKFILSLTMVFLATAGNAAAILDQNNDIPYDCCSISGPNDLADLGQSFTAGISGQLSIIETYGWNQRTAWVAPRDHTLSIYTMASMYSVGDFLGSVTQVADSYDIHWFSFDLSSLNLFINERDRLFMLWTSDGQFGWKYNSSYTGGDRYIRNTYYPDGTFVAGADQIFRTYVTPIPVPGSALLLLFSGLMLSAIRFSAKRKQPRSAALPFHHNNSRTPAE